MANKVQKHDGIVKNVRKAKIYSKIVAKKTFQDSLTKVVMVAMVITLRRKNYM